MDWQTIVSAVIGIILGLLGASPFFVKLKNKVKQAGIAAKEAADVLIKAQMILEDDKVTVEEIAEFQQELIEVRDALKALFSKEIPE